MTNFKQNYVINVETQTEYWFLMNRLKKLGYQWYRTYEESDLMEADHFHMDKKETCISFENDTEITFSNKSYFLRNGYKVITYKQYLDMNPTMKKAVDEKTYAVFVSSQDQYNALMKTLEKMGYMWKGDETQPTAHNYFGDYSQFAVSLGKDKRMRYGSVNEAKREGETVITFSRFLTQYKVTAPKVNFLLKYDLDVDPIEEFETMKEVEDRIDYLVQNARNLKKDSFVIYEVSKKHTVEVSTKITKKLVK